MTTRALKMLRKRQDLAIEEVVRRRLSGVAIGIMDIGKVFEAGRAAADAGLSVEDAVVTEYTRLAR